jgi:hypothetical protein
VVRPVTSALTLLALLACSGAPDAEGLFGPDPVQERQSNEPASAGPGDEGTEAGTSGDASAGAEAGRSADASAPPPPSPADAGADVAPPRCRQGEHACQNVCVREDFTSCGPSCQMCVTPPHAWPECERGACTFSCMIGYLDCDGRANNGCETDGDNDALNCGACGHRCSPGERCVRGSCESH